MCYIQYKALYLQTPPDIEITGKQVWGEEENTPRPKMYKIAQKNHINCQNFLSALHKVDFLAH
jgi:hypothetical protein